MSRKYWLPLPLLAIVLYYQACGQLKSGQDSTALRYAPVLSQDEDTNSDPIEKLVRIYSEDFNNSHGEWASYKALDAQGLQHSIETLTTSPTYAQVGGNFWLDQNHAYPNGKGTFNLWAFIYNKKIGLEKTDFTGAELRLRVRAQNLQIARTARIGMWFQSYDPSIQRYVNYFQVANTVSDALGYPEITDRTGDVSRTTDWMDVRIPFSTTESDWICVGSNVTRMATYGCSESVASILKRPMTDFGIFILTETTTVVTPTLGTFDIDQIEVWADPNLEPL